MEKRFILLLGKSNLIRCEWVDENAKSVKVRSTTIGGADDIEAWLPKKAMLRNRYGPPAYRLAKWYKPNVWTKRFLNLCYRHEDMYA